MYNAMMDPELMRLAQEQMSRISPQELAKIQQQMMSNPELMKMASESMKNMRPEDLKRAAEQLKNVKTEDMAEISEKVAKAKPEELAAMKAQADAQISYETRVAQMLKQEGNKLHGAGKFHEAADKYLRAKNNLQGVPSAKGGTLQLQCSLNLMSCYLKTAQYKDCIKEGSEILTYDSVNVKALYRRGQAYKELGNLEAALSDLRKAHEISPDDETIAAVFRDTEEKLMKSGFQTKAGGVVIEEIEEEGTSQAPSQDDEMTSSYSVSQPNEGRQSTGNNGSVPGISTADVERLKNLKDNPETLRSFQNYVSSANPDTLAAMGVCGMPPDMVKTATDMISKMKPEELQKMMEVASSLPNGSRDAPHIPEMTPEMIKMASDKMKNMSPKELQNMLDAASKMNPNSNISSSTPQIPEMTPDMIKMASEKMKNMSPEELQNMLDVASKMNLNSNSASNSTQIPEMTPDMIKMASDTMKSMSPEELQNMLKMASSMNPSTQSSTTDSGSEPSTTSESSNISQTDEEGTSSSGLFSDSRNVESTSSTSSASNVPIPSDLQESVRNSMKDPAMRQMFTSMMKNISPEMMASMSEQYGMKMSKEDAAKAQKVMSSLSPEDLDKMMRWADRAQRGIETVKKTKNWLLGRPGLILAICMLILAVILHRFGFIGV